jgi:hypothetical protein
VSEPPKPPREINPQAPAALEAICLRCLEKDPASRYASAGALADALAAAITPPTTPDTDPMLPLPVKRQHLRRTWLAMAAVILLGIVAGVLVAIWKPWRNDAGPANQPLGGVLDPPTQLHSDFGLRVMMLRELPQGRFEVPIRDTDGLYRLRADDTVRFEIEVAEAAWVGVLAVNAGSAAVQLFPNEIEPLHHFAKGEKRVVPSTKLKVPMAVKSEGKDWVWVQALTRNWNPEKGRKEGPFQYFVQEREREQLLNRQRGIEWRGDAKLAEAVLEYWVDPK